MPDELTPAEITEITGKKRASQQAQELAKRGIAFVFNGATIRVSRAVAVAYELLPQAPDEDDDPPRAVGLNAGLRMWQTKRNAENVERDAKRDARQQERREWLAVWRAAAPERRRVAERARGALRRATERKQTPPWADLSAIRSVYADAVRVSLETGVEHHVDHDLPLRGRLVSGLHVAANLRIIPAIENLRKRNRFEVT